MAHLEDIDRLCRHVEQRFDVGRDQISVVFAPYRICPLGAHIDHQLGHVTAMALDQGVSLAFAPHSDREAVLASLDFDGEVRVSLAQVPEPVPDDWGNYVRGAVRALQQDQTLRQGLVGVTAGRVAEGGLSSSAAVSLAYLLALQHVNHLEFTPEKNIELVQRIENEYLGLKIGILDQSAILLSRRDALTWINCAEISYELVARASTMPPFEILVAFSGLRQALVGTDYNQRVAECAAAAGQLLQAAGRPELPPRLGHVTAQEYELHGQQLAGPPARRAAHFFSEMDRVRQGVDAWRRGDLIKFGQLINESGRSSIVNYECGAPPLVDLYHILVETPGVYGARFSGAGFRGCCLALVDPEQAAEAADRVHRLYAEQHPPLAAGAWTMLCRPGDGARILESH